jgi:DNA-binding TFAR19-related protein (PDSD5 family)
MSNNPEIEELQRQIILIENNLRECLSKDALTRYFTIKAANPQLAIQIGLFIKQATNQKYINQKLSDTEFKDLLKKIQGPKKEFNILK